MIGVGMAASAVPAYAKSKERSALAMRGGKQAKAATATAATGASTSQSASR
jgi:hypothetical protein